MKPFWWHSSRAATISSHAAAREAAARQSMALLAMWQVEHW